MTIETETISVAGLQAEATIHVDRWGIPHIRAASRRDAFFVQGFNAARDRLWQIDLWRKRMLGRLAASFGAAYVPRDHAARLFLYRGDMAAEWASYGPGAKEATEAFVDGINAWLDLVADEPARLPPEFRLTGTKPERWAPEDVVRARAHARVRNLDSEIARSGIVAEYGFEADRLHKLLQPAHTPEVPDGFTPHAIPPEVLRCYLLATEPNALATGELDRPLTPLDPGAEGSNNWALAPSRTATGRAILASDPHRVHETPSLRYVVHMTAPGLDVIGAGEPAVPGVSLGHNDRVAFGLTIFPCDQEDLYVYELAADDPCRYRYRDGWEAMRVVRETIEVRDGDAVSVDLAFTRHGPMLHASGGRAYAVRSVWWEPGTSAYLASLGYLDARSWEDYLAALGRWGAPSTNHVMADVEGNIGWSTAAMIPLRPNWDGLMPVPGDGRYEWAGYLPHAEHPRAFNPTHGWVGSANQMNLPEGYPHKPGYEWSDAARYRRVSEVLEQAAHHTLADSVALQTDYLATTARRICALLADLPGETPARALLRGWDHRLDVESGPAALFEIWFMEHLIPGLLHRLGPPGLSAQIGVPDTELALVLLENPDRRFRASERDELLGETLEAAFRAAQGKLGNDPSQWAWGRLHHAFFEHPLSRWATPEWQAKLNIGPAPKGGSGLTVNNNGYRAKDYRIVSGVSWRMVVDVGNWDASLTVTSQGQSGDPRSPHYRDMFPHWAREDYVPMLYSMPAVNAATTRLIALVPTHT